MASRTEIRVAVNGYGVIGKRVAEAVAKQEDMRLVGVVDVASDWRPRVALEHGVALYGPAREQVAAKRTAGLAVAGSLESMADVMERVVGWAAQKAAATNLAAHRAIV